MNHPQSSGATAVTIAPLRIPPIEEAKMHVHSNMRTKSCSTFDCPNTCATYDAWGILCAANAMQERIAESDSIEALQEASASLSDAQEALAKRQCELDARIASLSFVGELVAA